MIACKSDADRCVAAGKWMIMAFEMREDRALSVILVRWRGLLQVEEVRRFYAAIIRLDLYHEGAPTLHDARTWSLNVPTAEMHALARDPFTPPRSGRCRRVAALVDSDLAFGMLAVLTRLREQPLLELDVFRDLEAAKAWIGIAHVPGDPFDPFDRFDPS